MKLIRIVARIAKGIYDILASYLLAWVVTLAVLAWAAHLLLDASAAATGYESAATLYQMLDARWGPAGMWARLVAFSALYASIFWLFRRPLAWLQRRAERLIDAFVARADKLTRERARLRGALQATLSLGLTALLIPFVLQPTLVGLDLDARAWTQRATNLADGTASTYLADSVVGLYRKLYAEPIPAHGGIQASDLAPPDDPTSSPPPTTPEPASHHPQPMMDRWNPMLMAVSGGDPERFARLKAVMWVESAGRQFAVSPTGCSGLMQFCAGTARSRPYRDIFGTGQISVCQCQGRCDIDARTERALETGRPVSRSAFPCDTSDARFHPERSLRAGALYLDRLAARFGGNLLLMYIGYNSGPAVAARVFDAVGEDPGADLDDISVVLDTAMQPFYGSSSQARARSLTRTHLPKLHRAFERYLAEANSRRFTAQL